MCLSVCESILLNSLAYVSSQLVAFLGAFCLPRIICISCSHYEEQHESIQFLIFQGSEGV